MVPSVLDFQSLQETCSFTAKSCRIVQCTASYNPLLSAQFSAGQALHSYLTHHHCRHRRHQTLLERDILVDIGSLTSYQIQIITCTFCRFSISRLRKSHWLGHRELDGAEATSHNLQLASAPTHLPTSHTLTWMSTIEVRFSLHQLLYPMLNMVAIQKSGPHF